MIETLLANVPSQRQEHLMVILLQTLLN